MAGIFVFEAHTIFPRRNVKMWENKRKKEKKTAPLSRSTYFILPSYSLAHAPSVLPPSFTNKTKPSWWR